MTILTVTLHPAIDRVLRVTSLTPNDISRVTVEMVYAGGKGNNVARALTRTNQPAIATGYQGGHTGAFATDSLAREGIQTRFVTCRQPTRTSILIQEDRTGYTYALYEPGQAVEADEVEALFQVFGELLAGASLVLLCGSGQGPNLAGVYAQMITQAHQAGVRCVLDSSGEALAHAVLARPYMVKVNVQELSSYLQRPLETREAQIAGLLELQTAGVQVAALSRGEHGMLGTDGTQIWEGQLRADHIVNVVGCGDSLLAGVAQAITEGASLQEMIRRGVAFGTANTQVRGAGYIELETINQMLAKVKLARVG